MAIDLKDIVTVSGEGGLFRMVVVMPQRVVLESIDAHRSRSVKQLQRHDLSTLENIGIYVMDEQETVPLARILWQLYADFGGAIPADMCATAEKRQGLMRKLVPNYDPERVYESSIKKIFQWYNVLATNVPDLFQDSQEREDTKSV